MTDRRIPARVSPECGHVRSTTWGETVPVQSGFVLFCLFLLLYGCRPAVCAELPANSPALQTTPAPVKLTLTYQYTGKPWREDEIKSLTTVQAMKEAVDAVRNCRVTTHNTSWMIAHAILAFGKDFSLYDPDAGREIRALQFLCDDRGKREKYGYELFDMRSDGIRVDHVRGEHVVQDHIDQFLMVISGAAVPLDYPVVLADGRAQTVQSILDHSKREIHTLAEIPFSLSAFVRYLPVGEAWQNKYRTCVSIDELAHKLALQPLESGVCFGTHRLYALALYLKAQDGRGPADSAAAGALENAITTARNMQNPDGSFGMPWYKPGRDCLTDAEIVQVSGHMLDWLVLCVPVSDSWLDRSCDLLARTMLRSVPKAEISYAWLAHSVEALRLRLASIDRPPGSIAAIDPSGGRLLGSAQPFRECQLAPQCSRSDQRKY